MRYGDAKRKSGKVYVLPIRATSCHRWFIWSGGAKDAMEAKADLLILDMTPMEGGR